MEPHRITKVTRTPAKISLKRNPFERGEKDTIHLKYVLKSQIKLFHMIAKYKTQRQKAFKQLFIHHSVSGTKWTDISKTQTKFVLFLFHHHLSNT
jgi:hypothetical protein